jgi:hypothetical protein
VSWRFLVANQLDLDAYLQSLPITIRRENPELELRSQGQTGAVPQGKTQMTGKRSQLSDLHGKRIINRMNDQT